MASPSDGLKACLKLSTVDFEIESASAFDWARIVVELECDLVLYTLRRVKILLQNPDLHLISNCLYRLIRGIGWVAKSLNSFFL